MKDPYQVLNIAPTASDDEVKHAYRTLARKYHPDNYHDNPLADLAQEKMKEINEAYEQIQRMRKSRSSYQAHRDSGGYAGGAYQSAGGSDFSQRVRAAIGQGNITLAEQMLNQSQNHDAEWHFLMGVVCMRRGWLDDAKQHFDAACRMDPSNEEYLRARDSFTRKAYYPQGFRGTRTMTYRDDTCMRLCTAWSCCILSGGRCFFC